MSDELETCPFCGGDAIIQEPKVVDGLVRGGFLGCSSLHECFTPHLRFDVRAGEREAAIAKWNRRAGGQP